jgi:hypothetical protein
MHVLLIFEFGTAGPRLSNGLPQTGIPNESPFTSHAVACKWTFLKATHLETSQF